ncbi:hypothetical protein [Brachyspira aalborgi]|nr:hypothetical protein [Brachyspira aalborgi]MBS4762778.1 hypothetical protein [Brachyspira sp.]
MFFVLCLTLIYVKDRINRKINFVFIRRYRRTCDIKSEYKFYNIEYRYM